MTSSLYVTDLKGGGAIYPPSPTVIALIVAKLWREGGIKDKSYILMLKTSSC